MFPSIHHSSNSPPFTTLSSTSPSPLQLNDSHSQSLKELSPKILFPSYDLTSPSTYITSACTTLDHLIALKIHKYLGFHFRFKSLVLTTPLHLHGLGFPSITQINSSLAVSGLHRDLNHHLTPFRKMALISLADWTCKYNCCLSPLHTPYTISSTSPSCQPIFLSPGLFPKTCYPILTSLSYAQTFTTSSLAIFLFIIYFPCPFSFFPTSTQFLHDLFQILKNMVILFYPNLALPSFCCPHLAHPSFSHLIH